MKAATPFFFQTLYGRKMGAGSICLLFHGRKGSSEGDAFVKGEQGHVDRSFRVATEDQRFITRSYLFNTFRALLLSLTHRASKSEKADFVLS